MRGGPTPDQQWIKTVFLTYYKTFGLPICFLLDQTEETLVRFAKKHLLLFGNKAPMPPYLITVYKVKGRSSQGSIYLYYNHHFLQPYREHKVLLFPG